MVAEKGSRNCSTSHRISHNYISIQIFLFCKDSKILIPYFYTFIIRNLYLKSKSVLEWISTNAVKTEDSVNILRTSWILNEFNVVNFLLFLRDEGALIRGVDMTELKPCST